MYRVSILVAMFVAATDLSYAGPADHNVTGCTAEPNAKSAACWWPPQQNVWTPIGWKDHLFRFNVLYNGTVLAEPHRRKSKKYTARWADQGVLLTITPSQDGKLPVPSGPGPYRLSALPDGGLGNQGWTSNPTPVLWTEWPFSGKNSGVVLRKEIFAHIPGASDVKTGIEPLYAWIRLSVSHVDELQAPEKFSFLIRLGNMHLRRSMRPQQNLMMVPDRSAYPRKLAAKGCTDGSSDGCRIVEEDGKVRLAAAGGGAGTFTFIERSPDTRDYYLRVTLPVRKGACADLLLPMIPGDRQEVDAELAVDFDEALKECDVYWASKPKTAALVETPETRINEAISRNVKLAQVIAEKNPETGEYSYLTGSGHYDLLWATPTSMTGHMLLDLLGYHESVDKHIELFRKHQGTVKPPGPSYPLHPGYFCSPKSLTSIDWLSDHGAILYEVAKHALLTGDQAFIDRWLGVVLKACEFIRDARAIEGHDGVAGVLPPAVATDREIPTQSGWNVGWNYKGLTAAVRLLQRIGHPRADEFAAEAREYRDTFIKALREKAATMPRWTAQDGSSHPVVPMTLSAGGDIHHAFYLDTGPLFLVWSGLLDASDELMRSICAFFREGPNTRLFDPRGNCWQRPVLIHEMSSCEPCYSWNVYHSWQLGDRYAFLEGMYSQLTGAISRQTYVSCETRHGIYGTVFASCLVVDLARLSVIDDVIRENELHLLRLVPKAWLKTDELTRFENMPTEFGPVTLRFQLQQGGERLDVSFHPNFRHRPGKVLLHVPPLPDLQEVTVGARVFKVKPGEVLEIQSEP